MASRSLSLPTGFAQIDPQGMKFRAAWGAPGIYSYGDVVVVEGQLFVCIAKSSVLDYPPTSPTVWEQIGVASGAGSSVLAVGQVVLGAGISSAQVPWPLASGPTTAATISMAVLGPQDATATNFSYSYAVGPPATLTITANAAATTGVIVQYAILHV